MGRLACVRLAARARLGRDRLAIIAGLAVVAPSVVAAQAAGRDTMRTIIIDSVQKTYGEAEAPPEPG